MSVELNPLCSDIQVVQYVPPVPGSHPTFNNTFAPIASGRVAVVFPDFVGGPMSMVNLIQFVENNIPAAAAFPTGVYTNHTLSVMYTMQVGIKETIEVLEPQLLAAVGLNQKNSCESSSSSSSSSSCGCGPCVSSSSSLENVIVDVYGYGFGAALARWFIEKTPFGKVVYNFVSIAGANYQLPQMVVRSFELLQKNYISTDSFPLLNEQFKVFADSALAAGQNNFYKGLNFNLGRKDSINQAANQIAQSQTVSEDGSSGDQWWRCISQDSQPSYHCSSSSSSDSSSSSAGSCCPDDSVSLHVPNCEYQNHKVRYFALAGINWAQYTLIAGSPDGASGAPNEAYYETVNESCKPQSDGLVSVRNALGVDVLACKSKFYAKNECARRVVCWDHNHIVGVDNYSVTYTVDQEITYNPNLMPTLPSDVSTIIRSWIYPVKVVPPTPVC